MQYIFNSPREYITSLLQDTARNYRFQNQELARILETSDATIHGWMKDKKPNNKNAQKIFDTLVQIWEPGIIAFPAIWNKDNLTQSLYLAVADIRNPYNTWDVTAEERPEELFDILRRLEESNGKYSTCTTYNSYHLWRELGVTQAARLNKTIQVADKIRAGEELDSQTLLRLDHELYMEYYYEQPRT